MTSALAWIESWTCNALACDVHSRLAMSLSSWTVAATPCMSSSAFELAGTVSTDGWNDTGASANGVELASIAVACSFSKLWAGPGLDASPIRIDRRPCNRRLSISSHGIRVGTHSKVKGSLYFVLQQARSFGDLKSSCDFVSLFFREIEVVQIDVCLSLCNMVIANHRGG